MTLTPEDFIKLSRTFPAAKHKFRTGSHNKVYAYLDEEDIIFRLIEIDPAYELSEPISMPDKEENIAVKIALSLKGVVRWGVGTCAKDSPTGEPTKSAVTDAFKRAARCFGIGLYLKQKPDNVNNAHTMATWLKSVYGQDNNDDSSTEDKPINWHDNVMKMTKFMYWEDNQYNEFWHKYSIVKAIKANMIDSEMDAFIAAGHIFFHRANKDLELSKEQIYTILDVNSLSIYFKLDSENSLASAWRTLLDESEKPIRRNNKDDIPF